MSLKYDQFDVATPEVQQLTRAIITLTDVLLDDDGKVRDFVDTAGRKKIEEAVKSIPREIPIKRSDLNAVEHLKEWNVYLLIANIVLAMILCSGLMWLAKLLLPIV